VVLGSRQGRTGSFGNNIEPKSGTAIPSKSVTILVRPVLATSPGTSSVHQAAFLQPASGDLPELGCSRWCQRRPKPPQRQWLGLYGVAIPAVVTNGVFGRSCFSIVSATPRSSYLARPSTTPRPLLLPKLSLHFFFRTARRSPSLHLWSEWKSIHLPLIGGSSFLGCLPFVEHSGFLVGKMVINIAGSKKFPCTLSPDKLHNFLIILDTSAAPFHSAGLIQSGCARHFGTLFAKKKKPSRRLQTGSGFHHRRGWHQHPFDNFSRDCFGLAAVFDIC